MTSPNSGGGSVQPNSTLHKVMTNQKLLTFVSFLLVLAGGLGFLMVMGHHQFSHKTYFSENALLPGLVINSFDQEFSAHKYLDKLREDSAAAGGDYSMNLLEGFFSDMGLEVYTHNFTLNFPFGKGKKFQGKNLYAILRAPRASSTESLVLSAPFRRSLSLEPPTDVSLALLLASAKFFRTQNYWAKDIIFLITEHELLGMQAWLEAYHDSTTAGTSQSILDHGQLEARAGAIQAAINLELSSERLTHINVKIQGLNGQLPNLDLFNLINRLCMKEGMGSLFQHRHDTPYRGSSFLGSWKVYSNNMKTLLSMMADQASGMANGNHGLFHRMGIEAVTLEGVNLNTKLKKKKKKYPEVDLYQMGRVIEGTFRSLNNLLERFHQSFFYYVLPSSSRYVSIGMYMPGFGVLAAGLILPALGAWLKSQEESAIENSCEGTTSPKAFLPDVFTTLPVFICSHLLGLLAVSLPLPASRIASDHLMLNLHYEQVVIYSLVGLSILGALLPALLSRANLTRCQVQVIRCFSLLELAAVSFTISLSNFSLAYLTTAFVIGPLALIATPNWSSRLARLASSLLMLIGHPLVVAYLVCLADSFRLDGQDMSLVKVALRALDNTKHGIMYSIIDSFIYGSVTYSLTCLSYLPIWTLLWTTVHSKEKKIVSVNSKSSKQD